MKTTIEEQLKAAIESAIDAGWSMNALCKAAGVSRSAVRDWYSGSRGGLTLETASKLAIWFGTELKRARIPKKKS